MTFIRSYWPYIVHILMAIMLFILWDLYQGQRRSSESKSSIIREKDSEIEYRKTKEGKIIAEKEAAEARAKDLSEAYPRLAKVLTDQMDIRLKNLRSSIQAEFRAMNSGSSSIVHDTIWKEGKVTVVDSVKINDHYLSFLGGFNADRSTLNWKYSYTDSITIALHVKKKWLFGNEKLYTSFSLSNPNSKVTNATSVHIQEHRDKRWVISTGISYDPFRNQFSPSVNFGYALVKF